MIDPILRQTEALLRGDIDAAQKMRWALLPPSVWTEGRRPVPPRIRRAR
ncbi:hypothetical protein [Roseivivax isoporae]|uniref:Uncharacterized protein n=1 Tax=Roseivivax isoporae LMG 25204 TaxID=1449351 RepID=X7FDB9_9RHOB|nr:hypothetical protein [Roseivivax isoporae]ETX30019.1 hypothetical protein RISW2_19630 [Roseivivax isoporae LMG 25204]